MPDRRPSISIPPGEAIQAVRLINPVNFGPAIIKRFMEPPVPGLETFTSSPSLSFLLEHRSGRKLVFDLGIRKDYENYSPTIAKYIPTTNYDIKVMGSVADILRDNGVSLDRVEGVIWRGRNLREISFDGPNSAKIGRFPTFDYFGDGSFYLLDSPGHAVGHLCGLARTTKNPDTFVLLGGDVCHYAGIFRPSKYLPVPDHIAPHPCRPHDNTVLCPGEAFDRLQKSRGRASTDSLFDLTFGLDIDLARATAAQLQELDCNEDIFVIVAHDSTVRDGVPHFPESLNDWKTRGLGAGLKWAFLRDLENYWKSEGLD
ncbi:hypothetical protein ACJZ2D_003784 [Fusarium nematophilum]